MWIKGGGKGEKGSRIELVGNKLIFDNSTILLSTFFPSFSIQMNHNREDIQRRRKKESN